MRGENVRVETLARHWRHPHAIHWNALTLDTDGKSFRVDITAERVKNDPGFDKDHWPAMADAAPGSSLHEHYNRTPCWSAPGYVSSDGGDL
jgi:hypothetical protein